MNLPKFLSILLVSLPLSSFSQEVSFYTARPDDPSAVVLTKEQFPELHADGVGDDSVALQNAIGQAAGSGHVLLIPEGRYRISRTIGIPASTRVIGFGVKRPVILLGANTPGYTNHDEAPKYMIWFSSGFGGGRQGAREQPSQVDSSFGDANPGTFYSALANVDIEIGEGNAAAAGIRSHYAQHCYIAHVNFHIGSGFAGIDAVGNEAEDLHFFGGDYGIVTGKPSPSWPFALVDATYEGQRIAAIKTEEGGLTLIRNQFTHVATAISVNPDRAEELWMKDCRFEDITGPALIISDEMNARTEINLENVVCQHVPVLAKFRESGREVAGAGDIYSIKTFAHGLHIPELGATPRVEDVYKAIRLNSMPPPLPSDIPALPSVETWANIMSLGAKGDGETDDTKAIQDAVGQHETIFFPKGRYKITDAIRLKPDTILIGLNPIAAQIRLADDEPGFSGLGNPKGMIESSRGGKNIIVGIGLDSGANNTRAVGLKWMAGSDSLVDDVRFLGGHGTSYPDGPRVPIYNSNNSGDADPNRRWNSESYSLWVTDGGGGTFANIWTPSPYAAAGICVSDTATEGRIYELSSEHHVRNEMIFRNVSNWQVDACQMEEERGESPDCQPVYISSCTNLSFANLYLYRVISSYSPFPNGVIADGDSRDLRFHNVHVYSPSKLAADNTIFDRTHGVHIRSREIALLQLSGDAPKRAEALRSSVLASDAKVEKLAEGFNDIECATADSAGNIYFVDYRWNRIYRWSSAAHNLSIVREDPTGPVQLACDRAGDLIVITANRAAYTFHPDRPGHDITVLDPVAAAPREGMTAYLAVNHWRDGHDFIQDTTRRYPQQFVSPDGTTFIPVPQTFGGNRTGGNFGRGGFGGGGQTDLRRAYGLAPGAIGKRFYVGDEFGQVTWSFLVNPDGSLSDPKKFCEEGEGSVTVDERGNVFVCAGNIFVYDNSGKRIGLIEVPDRPTSVAFGGGDRKTLFIAARSSLYAVRTKFKGQ